MPIPLDEVLATFSFHCDGHFVGSAATPSVSQQIISGIRAPDYTRLKAPTLALYALADHWTADYATHSATQREAFARALPAARVVAIPHSKHYLFLTNRPEVVKEVRTFLGALERPRVSVRSE